MLLVPLLLFLGSLAPKVAADGASGPFTPLFVSSTSMQKLMQRYYSTDVMSRRLAADSAAAISDECQAEIDAIHETEAVQKAEGLWTLVRRQGEVDCIITEATQCSVDEDNFED